VYSNYCIASVIKVQEKFSHPKSYYTKCSLNLYNITNHKTITKKHYKILPNFPTLTGHHKLVKTFVKYPNHTFSQKQHTLTVVENMKKRKGKEEYLYSAFLHQGTLHNHQPNNS